MTCFHESLVKCTGSLNANWSSCRAGAAVDGLPNNTSGELASTSAISATQDEEVILLQKTAKTWHNWLFLQYAISVYNGYKYNYCI